MCSIATVCVAQKYKEKCSSAAVVGNGRRAMRCLEVEHFVPPPEKYALYLSMYDSIRRAITANLLSFQIHFKLGPNFKVYYLKRMKVRV